MTGATGSTGLPLHHRCRQAEPSPAEDDAQSEATEWELRERREREVERRQEAEERGTEEEEERRQEAEELGTEEEEEEERPLFLPTPSFMASAEEN
jgi:hypothetical protein